MASLQKGKKVVNQDDLRRLMREKKRSTEREKRVESPYAKYNSVGQLSCALCNASVKSALLWQTHVLGKQHKDRVSELKNRDSTPTPAPSSSSSSSALKRGAPEPSSSSSSGKRTKSHITAGATPSQHHNHNNNNNNNNNPITTTIIITFILYIHSCIQSRERQCLQGVRCSSTFICLTRFYPKLLTSEAREVSDMVRIRWNREIVRVEKVFPARCS